MNYQQVRTASVGYGHYQQPELIYGAPSLTKVYCTVAYQILLHLAIIYCLFGVTYVIFFQSHNCSCTEISTQLIDAGDVPSTGVPTVVQLVSVPSVIPTAAPSNDVLFDTTTATVIPPDSPSNKPSLLPTPSPSTASPTKMPTKKPSLQPTLEVYENNVGDYKVSAQDESHGNWLLCDGSFVHSSDYPELFKVIGYAFGEFAGYPALFALPNAMDRVVGIGGTVNSMGKMTGNQSVSLSVNNLPSHSHQVMTGGNCQGTYSATERPYLSQQCLSTSTGPLTYNDAKYQLRASANEPNVYTSSSVGKGAAVNVMQPTVFVGNLFIWAA